MNVGYLPPKFLLVGNGSYLNRGCQAIAIGTAQILEQAFGDTKLISVDFGGSADSSEGQQGKIEQHSIDIGRYSRTWFVQNTLRTVGLRRTWFPIVGQHIHDAQAVLALGGDNYSMDYGSLRLHLAMIDYVQQHDRPFCIWGASLGPFKKRGEAYEKYVAQKLKGVTAIFARESVTIDYLAELGITENIYRVADPAFVMKPVAPPSTAIPFDIPDNAIGLNFSPLMAHYIINGDVTACRELVIEAIQKVLRKLDCPVILIPHVHKANSDDYKFLKGVADFFNNQNLPVHLLPQALSAPEIKWVMGRLRCFAGARTHSTIAAISVGTPTLSFSYSIKSVGINRDIFGHEKYVLLPKNITAETISDGIENVFCNHEEIRQHLTERLPIIKQQAYDAGYFLKKILSG